MYCEECGKKIDLDSKFCENCGTEVKRKQKKILMTTKHPLETKILITLIIISIFGFIFYQELKYFNSPENAINSYLKDCKNQNYDRILENLNISNSEFTSKEMLQKRHINKEEVKINDFKIIGCNYEGDKKTAKCEITYTTDKNSINSTKIYQLKRKESKRLLLFADWEIENQDIEIINDWTLYLPKDASAQLEQIKLDQYRDEQKDKTGYDAYIIPSIFKGNYNLDLKTQNGITLNTIIKVNSSSYTYQFNLKDISEDMKSSLKNLAIETINTFYEGVINNRKKEDLKCNYDIEKILNTYDELKEDIESDIKLKKFEIKNLKITDLNMNEEGNLFVTYQMSYQYEFDYNDKNTTKNHKGESNDTFYITIKNTDLKEIEKIDSLVSYFSKKY